MSKLPPPEARNGDSRHENRVTQPLREQAVFNNPAVLTEGWYPLFPSKDLKAGKVRSFKLLSQRLTIYRGMDGHAHALDAFCPHMGADLSNGIVEENQLRCYFHRWRYDGSGKLTDVPCQKDLPAGVHLNGYPVRERYGFVWVYAGKEAKHDIPSPPGLDGVAEKDIASVYLRKGTLFAHHHVMMANGIDLQHFDAVHGLNIEFEYKVEEKNEQTFDWILSGEIPNQGWVTGFGRWLLGPRFGYRARIAGGTIAAISYGDQPRFRGKGRLLPSPHILWGCVPLERGVSEVHIFVVMKKHGWFKRAGLFLFTLVLLTILTDDDIQAFPNMRFQTGHLIPADGSVARLIQMINRLPISMWTPKNAHS